MYGVRSSISSLHARSGSRSERRPSPHGWFLRFVARCLDFRHPGRRRGPRAAPAAVARAMLLGRRGCPMTGSPSPLYILPFDHRASFEHGLFGWTGALSRQQTEQIAAAKQVVYAALWKATDDGVP